MDVIILERNKRQFGVMETAIWFVWLDDRERKTSRETIILQLHLQNAVVGKVERQSKMKGVLIKVVWSKQFCW